MFTNCFTNIYVEVPIALAPILESLTTNKDKVKDSFNFTPEIVDQDSNNLMSSLDIDSLFANTPHETIEICTNELLKRQHCSLCKKSEFKDFLSLVTIKLYFYLITYYTKKLSYEISMKVFTR